MIGDFVSLSSGAALFVVSLLVVRAYFTGFARPRSPEDFLALAIMLGFVFHALNTLYWQVFGNFAVRYEWVTVAFLRDVGDYLDILFKGGAAFAGYLHLRAIQERLPKEDRGAWHWYEVPWYPKRRKCLDLIARAIGRRK